MMYRLLTKQEISTLLSQGCFADNWTDISVTEDFSAANIRNTVFEGKIKLGLYSGLIATEDGIPKRSGIHNSCIRNCGKLQVMSISRKLESANYCIEENVVIENVGLTSTVNEESTFGNGTEIEVLNEGGGRELPIFDRLSSQIAYLTVLYRHDKEFTNKMLGMIRRYSNRNDQFMEE